MFCVELTDSYKAKLDEITPNFEENLRRGFNNEGVRMLGRQKNKTVQLEDVAFSKDGVYMSLKNLELITCPEFRVKHFQIDLKNATVNVHLNLGQLTFEADVQMVNKTMFKDLAMVSNNKMRINITGVRALGRIGIFAVEDSFVPKNYDVDYIMDTVEIEEYENGTNAPRTIEFDRKECSPAALFAVEIFGKLYTLLDRQLGAVIVEYSINELLLDGDDEIREYKDYLRKRTLSANKIIDNLVNTTKNMRLIQDIEFPTEFLLSYKQDTSSIRGSIRGKGTIKGAGTLTRPTDWSLHESGNDSTVFGYLIIQDYRFVYDYQTEYIKNLIEGKITATIYKNSILVRLRTNKKEPSKTELELDFIELEDIEIYISGLGSLSWLQPNIKAILLGHIRTDTQMKVGDFLGRKLLEARKSGAHCTAV